jgi:hypothetical protein
MAVPVNHLLDLGWDHSDQQDADEDDLRWLQDEKVLQA